MQPSPSAGLAAKSFTSAFAGTCAGLLAALMLLMPVDVADAREATGDPYAGYSNHRGDVRHTHRDTRRDTRAAVVVERDRDRIAQHRAQAQARAQQANQANQADNPDSDEASNQPRAVPNPHDGEATVAASPARDGQARLAAARQQAVEARYGSRSQAQGQQHAAYHSEPRYSDSPRTNVRVQHRYHRSPKATTRVYYSKPKRAHVHRYGHPRYDRKRVITTPKPKVHRHRPFRGHRLHTGVRLQYRGDRVGVIYDRGFRSPKSRVRSSIRHCTSSTIRLHLRF